MDFVIIVIGMGRRSKVDCGPSAWHGMAWDEMGLMGLMTYTYMEDLVDGKERLCWVLARTEWGYGNSIAASSSTGREKTLLGWSYATATRIREEREVVCVPT